MPLAPGSEQGGVGRRYVRRVADDQVETPPGQRREPVALDEFNIAGAESLRIRVRHLQRAGGVVGRDDVPLRPFDRQRQADGPGSGPEVGDVGRGSVAQRQAALDREFGLRAWNQHLRRHRQRQRPELAHAGQIGQRFAERTSGHQRLKVSAGGCVDEGVVMCEQIAARPTQGVGEQHLGVQSCRPAAAGELGPAALE
jgi:hypothetical protein